VIAVAVAVHIAAYRVWQPTKATAFPTDDLTLLLCALPPPSLHPPPPPVLSFPHRRQ
jgi:hypothetical protein